MHGLMSCVRPPEKMPKVIPASRRAVQRPGRRPDGCQLMVGDGVGRAPQDVGPMETDVDHADRASLASPHAVVSFG